ncbi:MAG: peptide-methionine (S)-S-oxide reductase MsrA [Candidatus Thermoplasmatota archaeon]|jgi:peptide-methionine (S)-S-oxide reductase|nr:peptide-methionine (S)-S-oxide reductase MsrA [Candidatus Thermoplasmatota archaeon]MCL5793366.1 peptide-methionine (S)-S-oxide reductase MsrA [Candidatus Thermoplasmatota archaeon]
MNTPLETAVLGGGCFWCTEAVFQEVQGVTEVQSGYSGGTVANPTYEQVCTGRTGHAEVVRLRFDPSVISYNDILEIFFSIHDPTSLNRQGDDVGTQYRSAIFCNGKEQKSAALECISSLEKSGKYAKPIVTQVEDLREFYPSERYHWNYFRQNSSKPYCKLVISPKLEKFRKQNATVLRR